MAIIDGMKGTPRKYSIADAKNAFTHVVKLAETGAPVYVTRRGEPAVVIVSADDYSRMSAPKPNLAKALDEWRNTFAKLDIDPAEIWQGARDKSHGRTPPFED